jgi:hypothetical protein
VSEILTTRARIAALTRSRPPDDPELVKARRKLRGLRLAEMTAEVLNGWPPLTEQQIENVVAILHAGAGAANGVDHEVA